jgi:hypothetical protein
MFPWWYAINIYVRRHVKEFVRHSPPIATASRPDVGPTQPPIKWVPRALTLGVKWLGRKADNSPQFNVEVENVCSYTCTPQYFVMAWCLVKHRDNFTFTLTYNFASRGKNFRYVMVMRLGGPQRRSEHDGEEAPCLCWLSNPARRAFSESL